MYYYLNVHFQGQRVNNNNNNNNNKLEYLNTGWTVRGSNPGGARFSAHPDRPWGPPSLLYNGYRVFPEGKVRPGRAADPSPPSSAAAM